MDMAMSLAAPLRVKVVTSVQRNGRWPRRRDSGQAIRHIFSSALSVTKGLPVGRTRRQDFGQRDSKGGRALRRAKKWTARSPVLPGGEQ